MNVTPCCKPEPVELQLVDDAQNVADPPETLNCKFCEVSALDVQLPDVQDKTETVAGLCQPEMPGSANHDCMLPLVGSENTALRVAQYAEPPRKIHTIGPQFVPSPSKSNSGGLSPARLLGRIVDPIALGSE